MFTKFKLYFKNTTKFQSIDVEKKVFIFNIQSLIVIQYLLF